MRKNVLMLTGDYVDDYELMVPYSILTMFGCEVHVISPGKAEGDFIKTAIHYISKEDWELTLEGKPTTYSESLGHPFRLTHDFNWEDIDKELINYDALLLPGGRAPEYLSVIPEVQNLVSHFMKKNKPIGAICHGSQILTHTDSSFQEFDYLRNKNVYPYPSVALECSLLGAIVDSNYRPYIAFTDGNLVTGPSWLALPEFMKHFLKLLNLTALPEK